jgi:ribonuclease R
VKDPRNTVQLDSGGAPRAAARAVVELSRRAKHLVGEPYFSPGPPILLDRKGLEDASPGDLAVVSVGRRGRARLERVLGRADAIEAVLAGLLVERGVLPPAEPYTAPEPSLEGRVDLRDQLAFTIDPETAKDFDDAIAVQPEGDGLRAWVHIADVSWFVHPGTPLDRGAAERALSTYVPGLVGPMLPHELADDLCSLRPHQDRLCVTVEVPFAGPGLEQGEPVFYRSVIRSHERFTYGGVEAILAGRERAEPELVEALSHAERLARFLRERRFARGALRIQALELAFEFDGRGGVAEARREGEPHAHMLVEELMILANECVAGLLASRRRPALYRVHEPPDPQSVALLVSRLAELDVPTPPVPETMSPSDAARVAAAAGELVAGYTARVGRGEEAFRTLVLRALKQARYDPANLGHSGLASRAYCHFTSPIRRYPDLVVHRALVHELGVAEHGSPDDLDGLGDHCSAREREAAQIEYLADELCLAWLLEQRLFELGWEHEFEGEVISVIPGGLFARFGEVFEGFLPARRLADDYYELDELATALVGRRAGKRFRLGDPLAVRVADIRRHEGKVELAPAGAGKGGRR